MIDIEKVQINFRVDSNFYDKLAKDSLKRGLTFAAYTRYILKKHYEDHD